MNCFIQCHQGFIVNKDKINTLHGNNLYLDKHSYILPVSRKYRKEFIFD